MEEISLSESSKPYIILTSPVFVKETIGKFVIYNISGHDNSGEITAKRRYNEFKQLRLILLTIWGGTYIPPLPKAQFIVISYLGKL